MYHQLTSEQRYALNVVLHQKQQTKTAIAKVLGVNRSTIYRELKRNGGKRGGYSKEQAQAKANSRRQRLHLPRTYPINSSAKCLGCCASIGLPNR